MTHTLEIAERNLREQTKFGPRIFQVYGQDVIAVLAELDRLRVLNVQFQAAALAAIELPTTPVPLVRTAGRR